MEADEERTATAEGQENASGEGGDAGGTTTEPVPYHLLRISPQGHLIVVVAGSCFAILDLRSRECLRQDGASDQNHTDFIRGVAWNHDGTMLATAGDDKLVKIWHVDDAGRVYRLHGQTPKNTKKLTSVVFGPESSVVIYSDKFGEVFSASLSDLNAEPKVLLGHVSILTEVLLSPHGEHLLSADRDEKIRVSKYPKAYNIEAYCLGHREFVSRILIPSEQSSLLFSGSGDGTLRLWRYASGELLHTTDFHQSENSVGIVTLPVAFNDRKNILAMLVEDINSVHLLRLVDGKELKEGQILPVSSAPFDAAFDKDDRLWVATASGVEVFATDADNTYSPITEVDAITTIIQTLRNQTQAQAVTESHIGKTLSYASMRKRTHDKDKTKKRKTNESEEGTSSKENRKERRQRAKQQAAAKKNKDKNTAQE